MAFNAPAWITAASMSVLYSVVGSAAPLAILISFVFPMLVLALCLVYLTRHAPSEMCIRDSGYVFHERAVRGASLALAT